MRFDPKKDYYAMLGIPAAALPAEIKAAFRSQALKYHPDKHAGPNQLKAQEIFKLINEAWQVLSAPDVRREYDAARRSPGVTVVHIRSWSNSATSSSTGGGWYR